MMCTVRIILSSAALRQTAVEFRPHPVTIELAKRMGVDIYDRRLRLIAAVWASIIMTALSDLGEGTDWTQVGIDDIIARLEATFAEFMGEIENAHRPV
jgi:hypothetical protein